MDLEFSFSKRMLAVLVLALAALVTASFALGILAGRSWWAAAQAPVTAAKPGGNLEVKGK